MLLWVSASERRLMRSSRRTEGRSRTVVDLDTARIRPTAWRLIVNKAASDYDQVPE